MDTKESLHPTVRRVLGGHFRVSGDYATWRAAGTDDYLLIHTLGGAGRVGELRVIEGDAVLLRPGIRHDYATAALDEPEAARWDFVFAHFHPRAEWMPLLDWPGDAAEPGLIRADGEVHRRVGAALRRSARSGRSALARAELFAMNALEEALLWLDTQNPMTTRTDERVLRVLEHIGAHLGEPLDVPTLAGLVHLSPSHLSHLFTHHLGLSPQRHVERERIALAEQLIGLTDRPIGEIAREVGWQDPLYFSARFRRATGMSPTEFRQAGRSTPRR